MNQRNPSSADDNSPPPATGAGATAAALSPDVAAGPPSPALAEPAPAVNQHERLAIIELSLRSGIGSVTFKALLNHFGSAAAAARASAAALADVPGIGPRRAEKMLDTMGSNGAIAELELAARHNVRIITCIDPDYPQALKYLPDPPIVLYVRGSLLPDDRLAMAVVGSRRSSLYGQQQAERFAIQLAQVGFTVISGLARGIDAAAHRATVKHGGRTIAILGNGLRTIYPSEHQRLAAEVAESGAVISEYPMAAEPRAEHFPRRNRIISGMSLGVLVVEASLKSGALITAHVAAEQGKEVFAVPGRVDSPFSTGCHKLIQEGARLTQSIDDILEEFPDLRLTAPTAAGTTPGTPGASGASAGDGGAQAQLPLALKLTPPEAAIIAALDGDPLTVDEIADRSAVPLVTVTATLTMLELKRLIQSHPGPRYTRTR